ncbi:MAG: DUF983 domain-containing protein [Pedobacter sp.]|nr:MAG: DUF983 domain-containing protein [Pedobacter sp.]
MDTSTKLNATHEYKTNKPNPGMLSLFACKCPRCREGDMFVSKNPWKLKTTMKMHPVCPVCNQPFNLEVGFYYGSSYVSYALSIALSFFTLIAWWLTIGFSTTDDRFFYWMVLNVILLIFLQPYLMRAARTGWLAFFISYDPNWTINPVEEPERVNRDQENNW